MADNRSYVSGKFFMEIDGVKVGFLKSVDGGGITAEVINEPAGPSYYVRKHIGQPKYEDFTIQIGFSMSKAVYEWIASSWTMNYQRKNGMITALDYNMAPKSARRFHNALITETTIPACDGSSKEPAYMTVKYAPEFTRYEKPSGGSSQYGEFGKMEQKIWLPSNFRLDVDGLDCTRVNKVDSFTVKQTAVTDDIGDARDYMKEPGKLEFPNIKVSLAEVTSEKWWAWHEDFVIRGNNGPTNEKTATLTMLSPNREDELCVLTFKNMGIFKLSADKAEANADQIKRVTAELYCEEMTFEYKKHVVG